VVTGSTRRGVDAAPAASARRSGGVSASAIAPSATSDAIDPSAT